MDFLRAGMSVRSRNPGSSADAARASTASIQGAYDTDNRNYDSGYGHEQQHGYRTEVKQTCLQETTRSGCLANPIGGLDGPGSTSAWWT